MLRFTALAIFVSFLYLANGNCQDKKIAFDEKSRYCLRCHGNEFYTLSDSASGKVLKRPMYDVMRIDTSEYLQSNHKSFTCIDCHSEEFSTFPHSVSVRLEDMWACMDCHAGDEKYSKYHFEEIEKEFQQSIHHTKTNGTFTCWECHNPHTYKINVRNTQNVLQTIAYDNDICLGCHSDFKRYQLLTSHKEINLIDKHEWLPNQSLHFSQVRCIECHARNNDSIMVAHFIKPKENAIKNCVSCHSRNSILMASLYKYQAKESRQKGGFLNAIILNNSYVIGANRNLFLNYVSVILFGLAILGISVHLTIRLKTRKKKA